jgi:ferric-dicitrate binding protein FerR (iron transport regulator)/tetratricopeptide (TPR) repeat protein
MSEHDEHPSDHDETIENQPAVEVVLEHNLERLLAGAHAPPRVPELARTRMLDRLREREAKPLAQTSIRTPPHSPVAGARERVGAPSESTRARRRTLSTATLIAALAAALVLAWLLGVGDRFVDDSREPSFAEVQHENLELTAKSVTLADGSVALLRSGTTIDELGPRHLRLRAGEVLLDVVAASEPLLIETPQGRALVLGTRLLLRAEAERTFAAVLRGQAKLVDQAGELLLRAGDQAALTGSTPQPIAGRRLTHEIDWAKQLLADVDAAEPVRRGNLVARVPRWTGQTTPSPEWPLPIREMVVDIHVEAGHVRTTIDQTFFNPVARQLEGMYQFPLPSGAAVSRLAMYVDGQRMEAGVVTRERGRDIYEQIVHTRRDPALLEWMQGNLFQIRLFPLPGRTEKRVLLSYTQALDELYGTGELRVPIPAIDHPVGKVAYRIRVVGGARERRLDPRSHAFTSSTEGDDLLAEFSATNHAIGDDIVVDLHSEQAPAKLELHRMTQADARRQLAVTMRPDLRELIDVSVGTPPRDWMVLFDTSASRGPAELEAQRRFLIGLIDQLDDRDRLSLLAFDSTVRSFAEGLQAIDAIDRDALASFLAQETSAGLGLSDLAAAIDQAGRELAITPSDEALGERAPTLLLLGDGLAHASNEDQDAAALSARMPSGARFVAVSFGQAYDEPLLSRLAASGEGLHMHVAEGERDMSWRALELLSTLATARLLDVEARLIDASGQTIAAATTHASTRSLAEGERLMVLTELGSEEPEPVAIELSGRISTAASRPGQGSNERWVAKYELPVAIEQAGWLPRAWARAHVAALIDEGIEANAEAITKLGLEHFLVTPMTSLLVLENEAMYRDFDVHRPPLDAWASYPAPDRIEVVREGPPVVGEGELVARTPVPMLIDYSAGMAATRSRGWAGPGQLESSFGLGSLGLIGSGRGGGGFGGRGGFGFGMSSGKRASAEVKNTERADEGRFTSNRQQWAWDTATSTGSAMGSPMGAQPTVPSVTFSGGLDNLASAHFRGSGNSMPWPQALHWTGDARLDDLGEQVPALFEDAFDVEREELLLDLLDEQGQDSVRGQMTTAARERVAAARVAQANMRFRLPEGGELDIDGEGRFALIQERWGALDERVIYDGETLRADHPELGLSIVRQVGPTSPALLGRWVPWMIPRAEHLERFYVVETIDAAEHGEPMPGARLRLRPIAPVGETEASELRLEVQLDESDRVVAIELWAGEYLRSKTEFAWTNETLTISAKRPQGRARVLTRIPGPARRIVELGREQATRVELPLRSPTTIEQALTSETPGSAGWTALQQQRLAVLAALARHAELLPVLDSLREHAGRVLPGELALAGAGVAATSDAKLIDRVLQSADTTTPESAIAAYLRAGIRARKGDSKPMRALIASQAGTPIGMLASYRVLLAELDRRPNAKLLAQLETFLARYTHPMFGFVVTQRMAHNWWSSPKGRSDTWLALAKQEGPWTQRALHEAAGALYGSDDGRASELFMQGFERAREHGEVPLMDWRAQWSIRNTMGDAGWELTWTRLRERVAKSGDPQQALAFLDAAAQVSRLDEIPRVLERLDPAALDVDTGLALYDALAGLQLTHEANAVLRQIADQLPDDPAVLLRASHAAEQQGRLTEAADTLDRALDRSLAGAGLTLDELRTGFARLFELRARQARPLAGVTASGEALTKAMAVADRWRIEDPDNAEIDRLCAALLWSLDRDADAWRQLSSVIDRHPQEGEALAWLATALERSGELERADEVWMRAIRVEPTDPMHRLRRAQNLLTRELDDEAAKLLKEIREGEWQPRFSFVVHQAKQLDAVLARASERQNRSSTP